jgi:hypothetical protein
MDMEKIKDRIRKLLAKADNTACTVEEAKAFNDKAFELMEQYNLDRSTVAEQERETVRTHKTLQVLVRPWSTAVLQGLCHLYYCKWLYKQETARIHTVTIIGEEQNVAICHAIAVMVLRAVQQEARFTGLGRSFMTGAGAEILNRAMEMRPINRIAATTGQGQALMVLADDEKRGNDDYLANVLGTRVKPARKSQARISSAEGFHRGKAYGATLPLSRNLLK